MLECGLQEMDRRRLWVPNRAEEKPDRNHPDIRVDALKERRITSESLKRPKPERGLRALL